jgi:L-malate glycosyltransferase
VSRPRVVVVQKSLPLYRVPFFERLRGRLDADGIELELVHGRPTPSDAHRNDAAEVDWAIRRPNRVVRVGRRELVWQACLEDVRGADLVIAEQASRLLVNYLLLARQQAGRGRVAFWGHGANLQLRSASAVSESLKRRLSRRPHWWFAYTDGTRRRIERLGYPAERITVVQNAQDTEQLATAVAAVPDEAIRRFREAHDLGDGPVGLFLGSLTREKRLGFLLDACERIAAREPGFRLLVAGDGEELPRVRAAAARYAWLRPLGRVNALEDPAVCRS